MKTLAHNPEKTEILRRLKTLRADSAGRWGYLHVDHHLRQFGA